jgi:hypothetical protein
MKGVKQKEIMHPSRVIYDDEEEEDDDNVCSLVMSM